MIQLSRGRLASIVRERTMTSNDARSACVHGRMFLALHFLIAWSFGVCWTSWAVTNVQGLDASVNSNSSRPRKSTPFWEVFAADILGQVDLETNANNKTKVLLRGVQLVEANSSDPFANLAYYRSGICLFKLGEYSNAVVLFDKSLRIPETHLGMHLAAQHMMAECYKVEGDYSNAIIRSDTVIRMEPAGVIGSQIRQSAFVRKADLMSMNDSADRVQREEVEALFSAAADMSNVTSGDAVRARIANLKRLGKFSEAMEIGTKFMTSRVDDAFSPLIAIDLALLTNRYAESKDLMKWVNHFSSNAIAFRGAGLANLRYALMNAYTREQKYSEAFEVGKELQGFEELRNDPVPWGDAHRSSLLAVMALSAEELGLTSEADRLKALLLSAYSNSPNAIMEKADRDNQSRHDGASQRQPGHISFLIVVIVGVASLAFLVLIILAARRNARSPNV